MSSITKISSEYLSGELSILTSKSGGPGGQHVNKTNTKVILKWDIANSALVTEEEKLTILNKLSTHITTDGVLLITAQSTRSQLQNKEEAMKKLDLLIAKAFTKRKKRRPTKPTKSSIKKRLDSKKKLGEKKKLRRKL
ncbi:alternative ribosome rescue aminoacyl-tRNA hydrolase ArfB [Reichenbachiella sp. MALMAid0571]|uniref:alternative ribosome rescue aminoacyl-tRNA hydrolase ArfB n=1 Tax=Reichenbachiella sp. MALMAid0571 TaxID=3143939 RepID=UPI0032DE9467